MVTSRERVLAALNHEELDRVPIDLGSHGSSTIAALSYMKLRRHLGMTDGLPRMYNTWGQQCDVEEAVLDRLGADVVPLHRLVTSLSIPNDGQWTERTLSDGNSCLVPEGFDPVLNDHGDWEWHENGKMIARMPGEGTHGFTLFWSPMEGEPTREKINQILASENNNFISRIKTSDREVEYVGREAKRIRHSSDRAILYQFTGTVLENAQGIFGWDEFFVRCVTDVDLVHYFLEGLTELHLEALERTLAVAGPYVDVIQFGDDLGMNAGPLLDPDLYRSVLLPYHKKLFSFVREHHPNVYVMLHCDGSIRQLFPDLIDAGLQVFNPLQTDCANMDPAGIKRDFGEDLTFWGGGADTHGIMPKGTISQLREDVRRRMQILAPGGGFVFNQIHNILPEISPETIMAMFNAALEFGEYPIQTEGPLEELEHKYSGYWTEPLNAIRSEGFE